MIPREGIPGQMAKSSPAVLMLVVRVIKTTLNQTFNVLGRMDPFAIVLCKDTHGNRREVSRTETHYGGHQNPVWNHTCCIQQYVPNTRGEDVDILEFQVHEETLSMVGGDLHCGSACASLDMLLGDAAQAGNRGERADGLVQKLPLLKNNEATGSITVQAKLVYWVPQKAASVGCAGADVDITWVDPAMFLSPVRINGARSLFALQLKDAPPQQSAEYYVGKDLSCAHNEIVFYEQARAAAKRLDKGGAALLLGFMLEYEGVLTIPTVDASPQEKLKKLLVLRNLNDCCVSLRMLEIDVAVKVTGPKVQNSRLATLRQTLNESLTETQGKGFTVKGFLGPPPALTSVESLLEFGTLSYHKTARKVFRLMVQQMSAAEVLMHFLDVHQVPCDPGASSLSQLLGPSELTEIVLHEIVGRLALLARACREASPQKWIGTSIGIGYDCGRLPLRSMSHAKLREKVLVHIFNWQKAELTLLGQQPCREPSEEEVHAAQRDCFNHWKQYIGGVDQLSWDVMRAYHHRFGNSEGWREVCITVYDYDSASESEFIGRVTVPVQPTNEVSMELKQSGGASMRLHAFRSCGALTYSISYRALPKGSRLHGVWRVCLHKANDLPSMDHFQTRRSTDPFAEIVAVSEDGSFSFRQQTSVKLRTSDPVWNETFELPITTNPGFLSEALDGVCPGLSADSKCAMLPPEVVRHRRFGSSSRAPTPDKATASSVPRHRNLLSQMVASREMELDVEAGVGFREWVGRLDLIVQSGPRPDFENGSPGSTSTPRLSEAVRHVSPRMTASYNPSYDNDVVCHKATGRWSTSDISDISQPDGLNPSRLSIEVCSPCRCM